MPIIPGSVRNVSSKIYKMRYTSFAESFSKMLGQSVKVRSMLSARNIGSLSKSVHLWMEVRRRSSRPSVAQKTHSSPRCRESPNVQSLTKVNEPLKVSCYRRTRLDGSLVGIQQRFSRAYQNIQLIPYSFWSTFHPMMPFLDHTLSPSTCCKKSKLLFWSLLCVASNDFTKNAGLYGELIAPVKRLLWKTVGQVPHCIPDIQGMLLLCVWLLPCATRWDDPSFILISVVSSLAIANGAHGPDIAQEYRRSGQRPGPSEALMERRLWAAFFVTSGQ